MKLGIYPLVESYQRHSLDETDNSVSVLEKFIADVDAVIGKLTEVDAETTNAFETLCDDVKKIYRQ